MAAYNSGAKVGAFVANSGSAVKEAVKRSGAAVKNAGRSTGHATRGFWNGFKAGLHNPKLADSPIVIPDSPEIELPNKTIIIVRS